MRQPFRTSITSRVRVTTLVWFVILAYARIIIELARDATFVDLLSAIYDASRA